MHGPISFNLCFWTSKQRIRTHPYSSLSIEETGVGFQVVREFSKLRMWLRDNKLGIIRDKDHR
jgi:hypothetical protein